ncbi:MAG: hypothetical protein JOY71_26260 [Acetobacteraceae bacterium]|nr:hypothetical protein [Acetobacteraceae bacterium]MBV8592283.1 hypothetical protein [Acetobacteraceae bacterium]
MPCGAQIPIPGFSFVTPPEFIAAAEAVEMVIEWFHMRAVEADAQVEAAPVFGSQ